MLRPDAHTPLRGWRVEQDGGDGHATLESTQWEGSSCCDIEPSNPDGGGSLVATSTDWLVRSQEIDLVALGFSARHLDTAPDLKISERFAPLPPGNADEYFLKVELRDASHAPIEWWGRDGPATHWSFADASPVSCSSDTCALSRADGSPFWTTREHTFSAYGSGLRYVFWKDGGREAGAFAGRYGTLLDAPTLSVKLATDCGASTAAPAAAAPAARATATEADARPLRARGRRASGAGVPQPQLLAPRLVRRRFAHRAAVWLVLVRLRMGGFALQPRRRRRAARVRGGVGRPHGGAASSRRSARRLRRRPSPFTTVASSRAGGRRRRRPPRSTAARP